MAQRERTILTGADDGLLSTERAAEFLGLHPGTLRNWRSENFGPAWVRIGRGARVGYRREDLDAFIAQSRVVPQRAPR